MTPDVVRMDVADVYKQGVLAGHLRRLPSTVEFRYDEDYRNNGGPSIATTMPVLAAPVITPARSVSPYFAGLLPEGRRLTALRMVLKTSADDDFSMLLAVGVDPIGDVQIVMAGEPCPPFGDDQPSGGGANPASTSRPDLDRLSFVELFAEATGVRPDQVGIAGVQDKVSGRMVSIPLSYRNGPGSILKFDPPEFPYLVRNEVFFLTMAAACGIATAQWRLIADRDGHDGLLVTRFDRFLGDDGIVGAYAVEDGCQVTGRYPGDKYAVSSEEVTATLSKVCAAPKVAALRFLRQFIFAVITGNGDLHAKNLSVVFNGAEWLPSRAYDLPSSAPYGDHTLALAMQGSREGQVSRKRILMFGTSIGLAARSVEPLLNELIEKCAPWADRTDELPFDRRRCRDLGSLIRRRCRLLSAKSS